MLNTLPPPHQIHHHSCLLPHPINLLLHSSHHHHHHRHHHRLPPTQLSTRILYSLSAIDKHTPPLQNPPDNNDNHKDNNNNNIPFFTRIYNSSPIFLNERPVQKQDLEGPKKQERVEFGWWNMWWGDLKAAVGQRVNVEGLLFSVSVVTRNKKWVIPHVSVPDVRYIDWAALKRKGFEGVVFDKDNTLTVPYSLALFGPISPSVECCKAVFGDNIAVFSNSAGLEEYDPDDRKARALEFVIGIRVIRHKVKKPAGSAEEIERHFGCDSSKLIMVGDRPFTDIVYGNRNGFLTILTAPLSLAEEPFIVKQVRKIELALVNRWSKKGLKADNERLLPDALDCVKEPPFV